MEAEIVEQLDKFERTLDTLIESISTNNPSVTAAEQLVTADDAIAESLKQLATHQALYAQVQSLHAEAQALDNQIRERFKVLVDCRKDLVSIPTASVPVGSRAVNADEVLRMSNRISKFTTAPTSRILPPKTSKTTDEGADDNNGVKTSPVTSPPNQVPKEGEAATDSFASLPTESRTFLEERERFLRDGWKNHPDDNMIRTGLLMEIQHMIDRGLDPAHLSNKQKDDEAQRHAEEEEQRREKEAEEERKRRASVKASGQQRQAIAQQAQAHEDSGFDLFDPDED